MIKVKLVVIVGFLLAFGAGVVAGLLGDRRLAPPPGTLAAGPTTRRGLADVLKLTAEQQKEISQFQKEAREEATRERDEQIKALRKKRDDELVAMTPAAGPERRPVVEKIMSEYADAIARLNQSRPAAFDKLQARMREVLTDEQWREYTALQEKRREESRRHEGARRGETRPATRQAATVH